MKSRINNIVKIKPYYILIQSFLVALYVDIRAINWTFVYGGFVNSGQMDTLYLIVMIALLIVATIYNKNIYIDIPITTQCIIVLLLLYYALTYYFIGMPRILPSMFLILTIFSFLIPNFSHIDSRLMLKATMVLPFFAIFKIDQVFVTLTESQIGSHLDAVYGFLIPVLANIIYLMFYFKEEKRSSKIVTIIISIINTFFLYQLIMRGGRAIVLSISTLLIFIWCVKLKENGGIITSKKKVIFAIILTLIVFFSYKIIIPYLAELIDKAFGTSFYFINKMMELDESGNLSNGRNRLNIITWNGFLESPIFGNGIDRFDANTGRVYPHNFILQLLYDGGLILFVLLLVPVVCNLISKLKKIKKDEYTLLLFLFFGYVLGAFFAQDMWNISGLWMFMGFALSKNFCTNYKFVIKKKNIHKKC